VIPNVVNIVVSLRLQIIGRKTLLVPCPALAMFTPTTPDSFSRDLENFNFRPLEISHTPKNVFRAVVLPKQGVCRVERLAR
jgi:hypothetical protein